MKKKSKIAIIVVASIVLAVCICALTMSLYANRAIDDREGNLFTQQWMKYLSDDALLTDVVIPGSHDAGSAEMMWMAETQNLYIYDQLNSGTRYIDLRVNLKKGEYYICHSIINGQKLERVLQDVNRFLDENPSEVLLLDFQKFSGDGCKYEIYPYIKQMLGDKILSKDSGETAIDFISSLTVGEARGHCVLLWGSIEITPEQSNSVFIRDMDSNLRPNSVLHSYYTRANNTKPSKAYVDKVLDEYIEMYKEQGDGFFVLQAQLTDPVLIVGPKFMEATHDKNMSAYVNALKNDSEKLQYINVIMRDFVGARKNCEILALNLAKGLVNDIATFQSGVESVIG